MSKECLSVERYKLSGRVYAAEVDYKCSGLAVEGVVGREGRGGVDSWD